MHAVRALIHRHPAASYFALTFAISWSAVLAMVARHGLLMSKEDFERLFPIMLPFVVLGPSVSGVLLTGLVAGKRGLRDYASRLFRWRVSPRWYAAALLTAPLYFTASMVGLSAFAGRTFLPGIFTEHDIVPYVLRGVAVAFVAGIVEELGWTGFAIPTLRRRFGPMTTGLVVGVMWGLWHVLPKITGAVAHDLVAYMPLDLSSAIVGLTGYRILMVWVYDRTESLLLGILMHTGLTASTLLLQPTVTGARLVPVIVVLTVVPWIIVAAIAARKLLTSARTTARPPIHVG
jgi:uncharacterized protein